MNISRFSSLPNALKPTILAFIFMLIVLAGSAQYTPDTPRSGSGWFWLNILIQFVFMIIVCGLFLCEAEAFLTFASDRDAWPVMEMGYSLAGFSFNIINTFVLASWQKYSLLGSSTCIIATFMAFLLAVFYCLGGTMMYRIWRGIVKSGASQNPTTPNVMPGNPGGMHPGV